MKSLICETPVETEMDLVGRIVDAAGCIEDDPRVFDRVQESLLRIGFRCALTYRAGILNSSSNCNCTIKLFK